MVSQGITWSLAPFELGSLAVKIKYTKMYLSYEKDVKPTQISLKLFFNSFANSLWIDKSWISWNESPFSTINRSIWSKAWKRVLTDVKSTVSWRKFSIPFLTSRQPLDNTKLVSVLLFSIRLKLLLNNLRNRKSDLH